MGTVINATIWVAAGRVGVKFLTLLQVVIFGRLLGPERYAEFALSLLVVNTIELLTEQGLGVALIQRGGDITRYLPTVWLANIVRGILLGGVIFFAAPWVAALFSLPGSQPLLQLMALVPVVRGFENLANVTLTRLMKFRLLVLAEFFATLFGILIGCLVWLAGAGEASPVLAVLASGVVSLVASYLILPTYHGFGFSYQLFRELHRFGVWVMVSRYAATALTKGGGFAIAGILSPSALSFYQHADSIATGITMEVARLANRVALPMFSRANHDPVKLRTTFEQAFVSIAFVSTLAATLILVTSDPLIEFLLGREWLPAAELMPWVAVWGVSRSLGACLSNFLIAVGRPQSASVFQLLMLSIFAVGVYPCGVNYGAQGICALLAFTGMAVQVLRYPLVARILDIPVTRVIWMVAAPLCTAIPTYLLVRYAVEQLPQANLILQLFFGATLALAVFTTMTLIVCKLTGLRIELLSRLISKILPTFSRSVNQS